MRRFIAIMVALLLVFSLTACATNNDNSLTNEITKIYNAGTYEGEGKGHAGVIKVSLTVNEEKIEKIEFLEFPESDFAKDPANKIVNAVIKANSGNVDSVAGASATSAGVIAAINSALEKAKVEGVSAETKTGQDISSENVGDLSTEVLVIGAGGAGLSAAISATNSGAQVTVIEKMSIKGGNTKLATGGLNAAGTKFQKAQNIEDSTDLFYEDTMKGGGEKNTPELVRVLADKSNETVEWLTSMGADLSDVGRLGGASVNRAHRPTGGAPVGNHLVDVLSAKAEELGIEILYDTKAIRILSENNTITGVLVEQEGKEFTIHAKAIVIATGGFGANPELIERLKPEFAGYGTTNHPGATGDVFEFAEFLKPKFVQLDLIQTHPTVMPSNNYMITEAVRGNGAILVNREGKRFVNEIDTRAVVSDAQLAQTGKSGFLLFDTGVKDSLKAIDGYHKKGFLVEGATLEELAKNLNIDSATLVETVDKYNEYVKSGVDSDFGRPDMPLALEKGPFYAVEVAPAVHHTMGGLAIDTEARVLKQDNTPIDGLFAAGEVTGGVHGNNRLGGNALADITTFGRIAGENAAKFIKK